MDYAKLKAYMPLRDIVAALDDNEDGAADADVWTEIEDTAEKRIADAFAGDVPDEYVGEFEHAALIFRVELVFTRRGFYGKENPVYAEAGQIEKRLRALASGEESASAGDEGSHVGSTSKLNGMSGLII